MEQEVLSVTQLNRHVKDRLEGDPFLSAVCVRGELSNYKVYPSGHHYFSLKDGESSVRCVMFRGSAGLLRFRPENGMSVLAFGRVAVYPRDGAYQLYCTRLTPDGLGELHLAFEQLKNRLAEEGLFVPARKRSLPPYPHRIAIVTSASGAAVHDMLRILAARYPLSKVLLLPVHVQGAEAPPEIAGAIRYANRWALADVIITGRGGGSMEDLWAFNDERVVRAIAASEIPVVSAVGHEPDVTISDFAADVRAATPSNAAELVAPDKEDLKAMLRTQQKALTYAVQRLLKQLEQQLDRLRRSRVLESPQSFLTDKRVRLDAAQQQLLRGYEGLLAEKKRRFSVLAYGLDVMSPLKVLARGYSVVFDADGHVVSEAAAVQIGDKLQIRTADGRIYADVTGTEPTAAGSAAHPKEKEEP